MPLFTKYMGININIIGPKRILLYDKCFPFDNILNIGNKDTFYRMLYIYKLVTL